MKLARILRRSAVGMAVLGLLINGPFAIAARPVAEPPVRDISLSRGGVLHGQILNDQGAPVTGARVTVRHTGLDVATTQTQPEGTFLIAGLRGGIHEVVTADQVAKVRLWAADTAPPSAQPGVLFVGSDSIVRGQTCPCGDAGCHGCGGASGAWGTIGAIALVAGIAVAIYAIADDDSGS
jgi:hypothetical protein